MLTNLDFHLQTGNLAYKTGFSFTKRESWVTKGILGLLFTIKEGKNETLLFCDGKLFPGFDKKEYFLWQGKDKYINMEVNTETLSKGEHVMFVVTVECIDDYITAGKSLNRKVYINEEK